MYSKQESEVKTTELAVLERLRPLSSSHFQLGMGTADEVL